MRIFFLHLEGLRPLIDTCQLFSASSANHEFRSLANGGFQNLGVCLQAFPSSPSPTAISFLALSPFSARAKHQKSRSLLPNPTDFADISATEEHTIDSLHKKRIDRAFLFVFFYGFEFFAALLYLCCKEIAIFVEDICARKAVYRP